MLASKQAFVPYWAPSSISSKLELEFLGKAYMYRITQDGADGDRKTEQEPVSKQLLAYILAVEAYKPFCATLEAFRHSS